MCCQNCFATEKDSVGKSVAWRIMMRSVVESSSLVKVVAGLLDWTVCWIIRAGTAGDCDWRKARQSAALASLGKRMADSPGWPYCDRVI